MPSNSLGRDTRNEIARSSKRQSVVIDASAVTRALADRAARAIEWVSTLDEPQVHALVPELFFAELGNALLGYVRAGRLTLEDAEVRLDLGCGLPVEVRSLLELAPPAMRVGAERGLTVYDACYAVLAEVEDAVLVTADRHLAESVRRAELV